ncbi:hypothetical protein B0H13DRAFT_1903589 [Mycena leptocephala]|nr:hypothetical protein B0H13DRAFT_1903589 [Mycena leptocephala]
MKHSIRPTPILSREIRPFRPALPASSPPPRVKPKADEDSSDSSNVVGKTTNLVTTDLGNIVDSRDFLFMFLLIPLKIILCVVFLYHWTEFVRLHGCYVAKLVQTVQRRLKKTDLRVQAATETMNVLRTIKLALTQFCCRHLIKEI